MNESVTKLIVKAREARGFTQTQMAEKIAKRLNQTYSLRQYQRIEEGKFPKYKSDVIKSVDEILGLKTYDTIYDINRMSSNKEQQTKAFAAETVANEDEAQYGNQKDLLQAINNLSYQGKKNADSMDKMADSIKQMTSTNERNSILMAAMLAEMFPNSVLAKSIAATDGNEGGVQVTEPTQEGATPIPKQKGQKV